MINLQQLFGQKGWDSAKKTTIGQRSNNGQNMSLKKNHPDLTSNNKLNVKLFKEYLPIK